VQLSELFIETAAQYTADQVFINRCWNEIDKQYNGPGRHYHNCQHLLHVMETIYPHRDTIKHWQSMVMAVFYHDIVYKVPGTDNETKSAVLASTRLQHLGFPPHTISICHQHILATHSHETSSNDDTNLFTDADLAILGQAPPVYKNYCKQIRKEYAVYPGFLYKPGRRKVLRHFLQMKNIYKTTILQKQFEEQARANLSNELQQLGG
jgi:predicted metal-dependent HD superfamily phosphohydrolase